MIILYMIEGSKWYKIYMNSSALVGSTINSFTLVDFLIDGRSHIGFDEDISEELIPYRVSYEVRCSCGAKHMVKSGDFPLNKLVESGGVHLDTLDYPFVCDCVASEEYLNGALKDSFKYINTQVGHLKVGLVNAPLLENLRVLSSGLVRYGFSHSCECVCGELIDNVSVATLGRNSRLANELSCGCMNKNGLTGGVRLSPIIYRMYRGGRFIYEGTLEYLSYETGYERRTLSRYATPSWHRDYLLKVGVSDMSATIVLVRSLEEEQALGLV